VHKTGEISTATHDAGIVFLPGRAPYIVALLAEGGADPGQRQSVLTAASAAVYDALAAEGAPAWR
jgi:beta-lactamase class A